MNRKNLTAAVLAGLAGAAGIAGTAQAVNVNPDGLGQVLIYPYFTSNDGNQTVLSVVNTTNDAKAVKVRFLEGFNSREVLDFNLYMSHHDVWVGAVFNDDGTPSLAITDTSCTVPYLQGGEPGDTAIQPFLNLAYAGKYSDGGPEGIERAAEGHIEVIEMGTLIGDSADDATHTTLQEKDDDGNVIREWWAPEDCDQLVENWTEYTNSTPDGIWWEEAQSGDGQAHTDTTRNSGGLFGGAAIVNTDNGTMFSYDAIALQGYDTTDDGVHYEPGDINPSLDDGSENSATIFFGVPQNTAVTLEDYPRSVDAISALFMHENLMNEYVTDPDVAASTEWVVTFPTKAFYVDELFLDESDEEVYWAPDPDDPGCGGWQPGEDNPVEDPDCADPNDCPPLGWEQCTFLSTTFLNARPPFTEVFDGESCEVVTLDLWDREERTPVPDQPGGARPPVVSPSLPSCDPDIEVCDPGVDFELCYEVNVIRFGEGSIFGTPEVEGSSLLVSVGELPYEDGWAKVSMSGRTDQFGLVGLPAIGFAANEYENEFLGGGDVKAFYGGLFSHKANVRRVSP
jgi:hypothetical protein